ncbi:hypothetical protein [Pollutimonas bauzanensis]|uniref:hypothetical protein n=1 Tax=Pollutimonas bauzanensis TaxID=658167 RepID=UPI00334145FB
MDWLVRPFGLPSPTSRWRAPKVAHIPITVPTAALSQLQDRWHELVLGMLAPVTAGSKKLMRSSCAPRLPGHTGH